MRAAVNANYFLRTCEMHSLGKSSHAAEGGTLTQQLSFSAFLGLRLADARVNTTLAGFSEFRFRGSELYSRCLFEVSRALSSCLSSGAFWIHLVSASQICSWT